MPRANGAGDKSTNTPGPGCDQAHLRAGQTGENHE
jgi:hypothetical protein